MVSSTWSSVSAFGVNPLIGALSALGATRSGWCAYRPKCRICIAIRPPAACTAEVISRCCSASASVVILAPPGKEQARSLGAMPPVTMRPTPPRARSA